MPIKEVDEATTRGLLNAFGSCEGEVNTVHGRAEDIRSTVMANWSGVAATNFSSGVNEWQRGLQTVRGALQRLEGSMSQFAQLTASTEDDNATLMASAGNDSAPSWT